MVQCWEPGTAYGPGAIVEYEGAYYKIIQPHTSQSNWTPPATEALWGRLPNEWREHHEQRHEEAPRYDEKPPVQQPFQQQQQQPQSVNPPQGQEKHWYDLDEKQKKTLEIGGGLAVGAGLLAAGLGALRHHEKKQENQKLNTYNREGWIREARERTEAFNQRGPQSPTTWILVEGKGIIPPSAIVAGRLGGEPVYIVRAFHEGGVQLGHATRLKGAQLGYAHNVIALDLYEVLIGDSRAITWVDVKGRFKPEAFGDRTRFVEGGHEGNGTSLYIALVNYDGVDIPGKASRDLDGAFIAYDGTEKRSKEYKVLAYA